MTVDKIAAFGKNILFPTILERDENQSFNRTNWRALADLNFFNLFANGTHFLQEIDSYYYLAKESLDIPFCLSTIAHNIGIKLIVQYGSTDQKAHYLNAMQQGNIIAAITNAEKNIGTDVMSIQSSILFNQDNEAESLSINKIGSNAGDADLIFLSLYKQSQQRKLMSIFLLDKNQVKQISHTRFLFGFQTGLTGEISSNNHSTVKFDQQLGSDKVGLLILNDCFNLERLYIATMIIGVLDGIIKLALDHINHKKSFNKLLSENQYIQEKIITIYSIKTKMQTIVNQVGSRSKTVRNLKHYAKELAILKIMIADEALTAAIAFFEIFGYIAYTKKHIAHKIIKDLLAFKFLGGSKEQQKILLFKDIERTYA